MDVHRAQAGLEVRGCDRRRGGLEIAAVPQRDVAAGLFDGGRDAVDVVEALGGGLGGLAIVRAKVEGGALRQGLLGDLNAAADFRNLLADAGDQTERHHGDKPGQDDGREGALDEVGGRLVHLRLHLADLDRLHRGESGIGHVLGCGSGGVNGVGGTRSVRIPRTWYWTRRCGSLECRSNATAVCGSA